jgi:hypothetical protein
MQLTLRAPGSLGSPAAKQPPTVRGYVKVYSNGLAVAASDTQLEPMWTWLRNQFENVATKRNDSYILSCRNSDAANCHWWGEPGGASKTVWYGLDPSLNNAPGVSIVADLKNTILPAWSQKTARSPILKWCNSPCSEHIKVQLVSPPDPDIGNNAAAAQFTQTKRGTTRPHIERMDQDQ